MNGVQHKKAFALIALLVSTSLLRGMEGVASQQETSKLEGIQLLGLVEGEMTKEREATLKAFLEKFSFSSMTADEICGQQLQNLPPLLKNYLLTFALPSFYKQAIDALKAASEIGDRSTISFDGKNLSIPVAARANEICGPQFGKLPEHLVNLIRIFVQGRCDIVLNLLLQTAKDRKNDAAAKILQAEIARRRGQATAESNGSKELNWKGSLNFAGPYA